MRAASLAALLAAGCLDSAASFTCSAERACAGGRQCVSQLCAAADTGCSSGFRWDDTAGKQSGKCADFPDMAVSEVDMTDPNCGNGALDPGELCDPGMGSAQPCPTPATCNDNEACTNDLILPPGSSCQQICAHTFADAEIGRAHV